jgi:hypothetical protein
LQEPVISIGTIGANKWEKQNRKALIPRFFQWLQPSYGWVPSAWSDEQIKQILECNKSLKLFNQ